jgi:ParB/RepB/Spo0J family partition protein
MTPAVAERSEPTQQAEGAPAAFRALDERFEHVPIAQLLESPFNPRKTFDTEKLKELSASIFEKGVIEPIVVRAWSKHADKFEIVAGARRYRAAKAVGLTHLPAVIRTYTDAQVVEIMAIENGQRDDVLPLEEAAGYKQLLGLAKGYSARMIAERIGRTEKYVWDRLRLLDLVDEAKALLQSGAIGVEHAEVIAKLKGTEQRKVIARTNGGLFTFDGALAFDDRESQSALERHKPVSVRELKEWIARHIRFDVKHAAAAAPLEFGPVAERVEQAQAVPGRGKRVVSITFEHYCPDAARTDAERTYGSTAWKKAEGKDRQPTCEHAVLGLVVAGEHYGQSFHVCIARDRCTTHWKQEIAEREKNAKLRAKGQGARAAQNEARQRADAEAKRREDEARRKAWQKLQPLVIAEAIRQVKENTRLTAAQGRYIEENDIDAWGIGRLVVKHLGKKWFERPSAAWLVLAVDDPNPDSFNQYIDNVAKPLGLDIRQLEAIRDKHQPKNAAAASAKKR